ncbi:MAG: hypothetical protein E7462_01375 [Ruminococcaceae bacterium]|nr:hypothetical protein [Oscillospiraceae bacterium]
MDRLAMQEKVSGWIKKYKYFLIILLIGIGFMLIPGKSAKEEPLPVADPAPSEPSLVQELEEILSQIEGAGNVRVMLTLKAGSQTVYQTDKPAVDREDTVIITDGDRTQSGLIAQVLSPTYRGAIVLCQGAERAAVCLAVTEAVAKVTGLDASQISVLKMK